MLEFVVDISIFFVLFVLSGLAAVFFTWKYLSRSWMQLLLGYLGAVAFATGVSTSLLGFTPLFSVMLALGVSAALIGFGLGAHLLLSGYIPWIRTHQNNADTGENTGNNVKCYSDGEIAEVKENVEIPGDQ